MINKTVSFASITLTLSLLLAACTSVQSGSVDNEVNESMTLKMVMMPFLGFAPFFIAEEEGYFADEGLNVEYVDMNSGVETIPGLLQGDLHVSASALNFSTLNAIQRGGQLKMVASNVYFAQDHCPASALLTSRTLAESGALDSPEGWRGKRLATNPTGIEGYYIDILLQEMDLSLDDVETEDIPPPIIPEALESGAVDFAHSSEPWVTRIRDMADAQIWAAPKDIIPDSQFAVILYGPSLLEENREGGERFMRAYLKAVSQYNEGKTDRNVEILVKYTELDSDLLRELCWPPFLESGQINVESVLQFQEWGLDRGLLDGLVSEEDFWDGTFIDKAN